LVYSVENIFLLLRTRCLVDVQNSRVRIGGVGFLQMSFGLAIYVWGIVPDISDEASKALPSAKPYM
jgi:hypothetical protein